MILRTQVPFTNHVLTPPRYPIKNRSSSTRVHFSVNYCAYLKETTINDSNKDATLPTMIDILSASLAQNLNLQLQTLGPFFRIMAKSLATGTELGKAEGLIRVWLDGKILHLDSIRLKGESHGMEKSVFGIGLFIGVVAIRHGYYCGCKTAQLLVINDSDVYHSKKNQV